ncbi:uncharacterized protein LOC142238409 [Haematobia irritans]|uniref:uncharacterized protein LOC142238409 n=1 Tax=Haematobia irritans TaxID=7368 RepID=UPI003F506FE4
MDLAAKVEELIKLTTSLKQELDELKGKDVVHTSLDELEKEMGALKNDVNELRYVLMKQNAKILALIHQLPKIKKPLNRFKCSPPKEIRKGQIDYSNLFPVATLADLENLEATLDDSNIPDIVEVLETILLPKGIISNIGQVFSIEVMMECNLEGIHGKTRLQKYKKFMNVLFQAVYVDGYGLKSFLNDIRRGLKLAKSREFRRRGLHTAKSKRTQHELMGSDDEYGYESNNFDENDCQDETSQTDSIIKFENYEFTTT